MIASSFARANDLCSSICTGLYGLGLSRGMSERVVDAEVNAEVSDCLSVLRRGGFGILSIGATAMGTGREIGLNSASRSTFGVDSTAGSGGAGCSDSCAVEAASSAAVLGIDGLRRLGSRRGRGGRDKERATSRVLDGGRRFGSRRRNVACEAVGRALTRISGVPSFSGSRSLRSES